MEHITSSDRLRNGKWLVLGTAAAALLALGGCAQGGDGGGGGEESSAPSESASSEDSGSASPEAGGGSAEPSEEASGSASASGSGSASASASGSGSASGSPSASASGTGENDPAFASIDAALAEHPDATVISVDRDDAGMTYDIDLVEGEAVLELEASSGGGEVRQTDTDDDAEDVAEAREAQVSASDAITTALDGRTDRVLDEAELDRHDGTLIWSLDLDDAQGADAEKVRVDASTGETVTS
ncbi:PepSY domain-containing protein [Rothia halotolerans]|uniref:PepSY domain-containing protein n=1 Tax=Rothia halotolerans TaxID=405770 RepID=UPI00101D9E32|nr:PepSY domain-containing protein [Rothia halotolerans]